MKLLHLSLLSVEQSIFYQSLARKIENGHSIQCANETLTNYGKWFQEIQNKTPKVMYQSIIDTVRERNLSMEEFLLLRGVLQASHQVVANKLNTFSSRITSIGLGEAILKDRSAEKTDRLKYLLWFLYHYTLFTEEDVANYIEKHPTEEMRAKTFFQETRSLYSSVRYYSDIDQIQLGIIRRFALTQSK